MSYILALHVISFVAWFAGLFYLPRLFVYHADAHDDISNERFKVMERRLYKGIMLPAMIATIVFGLWLLFAKWSYYQTQDWMHAKLILVALLIVYHHVCGAHVRKFAANNNQKSSVYFRFFNEVPTVLLIAIVLLAFVKPF